MPEGDVVWRTARRLHEALAGKVLTRSDLRVPRYATADLAGRTVHEVTARGKHLLHRIGDGPDAVTLHTHLRMEGAWHVYRPGSPWRRPGHQVRAVLHTAPWVAVGFSLGVTEVLRREDEERALGHLGPDLLGADWDLDEALRRLRADPGREIGEALLDQRNLAGIGNLYKAEVCFIQGVHPATPLVAVPDLERLVRRAKALLEANRQRAGQTTTGDTRPGRRVWVYGRAGQPCLRCGTAVAGADESDRVTYWCPRCQPQPQ
ncbi:MAG: DNA glycosylase [Actinomycetota bacterium]|nr:DNA glycosylase [Actinomycetota bacterium]